MFFGDYTNDISLLLTYLAITLCLIKLFSHSYYTCAEFKFKQN